VETHGFRSTDAQSELAYIEKAVKESMISGEKVKQRRGHYHEVCRDTTVAIKRAHEKGKARVKLDV